MTHAAQENNATISSLELFFTVAFTVEMVVKMVGLGLVENEDGYFRSMWNWLDFAIVVEGLYSLASDGALGSNFSGIRSIRALRPLRSITRLQGLRVLVDALLYSLPLLVNTLIVCAFYFMVFGIVGVQLWTGAFRQRCFDVATGEQVPGDDRLCGGVYQCDSAAGHFCAQSRANPNNVTNFDNILWAFATIFQCITLEGWVDVMYFTQDSFGAWTWVYVRRGVSSAQLQRSRCAVCVCLTVCECVAGTSSCSFCLEHSS